MQKKDHAQYGSRTIFGSEEKKCHLYRIGGVEDHIHIVTHIHPSVAPAMLVKDIKLSTSELIKNANLFSHFNGWQNGYRAFTYHINSKEQLIQYVRDQANHHKTMTFRELVCGIAARTRY